MTNQPRPPQSGGYGCFGKVSVLGYIPFYRPEARMRERAEGMYPSHTIK